MQVSMGDAGSLLCMVKNCREEVVACVQDKQCKAALDALTACGLNDQVPHLLPQTHRLANNTFRMCACRRTS